jgi:putative sigma-54 modulation protein
MGNVITYLVLIDQKTPNMVKYTGFTVERSPLDMLIHFKGKNLEVTEALKNYTEKKLAKLDKHFHDLKEAHIVMSVHRGYHLVEVQMEGDGILLRAEERKGTDMYGSIDQVVEKLELRAQKFKGKRIGKTHDVGPKEKEAIKAAVMNDAFSTGQPIEDAPGIVRVKKFAMEPMTSEEAAHRMELLHHTFYIFQNEETHAINVVYKREDGNYGLIELI